MSLAKTLPLACAWALALLVPRAAMAQADPPVDAPPAATADTVLDAVTVEGEDYDPRRDDVAARIVVSSEELSRFGDTRLVDALQRLPGVTVGRGGGLALRGMASYTQVLVDGERLPPGSSLESISPDMVERVEIRRSATADLSTEAVAGTINIVLRKTPRQDTRRLQLSLAGAPGRIRPSATWIQSRREGARAHSLGVALRQTAFEDGQRLRESVRLADGSVDFVRDGRTRSTGGREALVLTPRWSLKRDDGALSADGLFDASRYRKDGRFDTQTLAGRPPAYPTYTSRTELELLQLRTRLQWEHATPAGGRWNTSLTLYGNREDFRYREQAPASANREALDQVTHSELAIETFASTGKYAFPAPENHAPEVGWDIGEDRRGETRRLRTAAGGTAPGQDDLDFDADVRRIAFYGQDEWNPGGAWSLYLGARWERIATRTAGNRFDAVEQRVDILSPIVQALWKPKGRGQLRLALTRTYKAPPLRLLIPRPYLSLDNSQLDPDLQGNPRLRPERALGLDATWEYFRGDDVTLSVGAYVRRLDDVVRSETQWRDERWVSSPVNGGDALAWGLETEGKLPLRRLGSGAPATTLSYSFSRHGSRLSALPGPGNRLDDQPAVAGSLGLDHGTGSRFSFGASWRYSRYDYARTSAFQAYLGSSTRALDVYAHWRLATGSRLRLGLNNALGDDAVRASAYRAPDGAQDVLRFRDVPRSLSLVFEHDF